MGSLPNYVSSDAVKIVLVLSLSFLIGIEREEHKVRGTQYAFGGVRTFPLIGLLGFVLAFLSGAQLLPVAVGLLVVGCFMLLSYRHKLATTEAAGITTEISALVTYLVGALVYHDRIWMATSLTVASVLLLELKVGLESLTKRIPAEEIITLAKFLLLSAVILPVVPNQSFTRFQINPYKTWLVVVAVSAVSYGSYLVQQWTRGRGGAFVTALLGGSYSSTVTTVVLARLAAREPRPHLFAGSILTASGVMYLRLALLVGLFSRALFAKLGPPFLVLFALAVGVGWLWSRRSDGIVGAIEHDRQVRNPLDLGVAFLFATIFVFFLIVTQVALTHVGRGGVYSLAALMGVFDVDPIILSLTQTADHGTPVHVAAVGIVIAASSNNVIKGVYSLAFADRRTGSMSLLFLLILAGFGLLPWIWI
jgi:uncharacterized membrane protein (DUF4010 family)